MSQECIENALTDEVIWAVTIPHAISSGRCQTGSRPGTLKHAGSKFEAHAEDR